MCVTCGCGMPEDNHGDDRNITLSELQAAADAVGITLEEAVDNINEATGQNAGASQ